MSLAQVNMTEGPLAKNIIRFSIPVILTGILQLLFNACDLIVVGRFSNSLALAAVGATGSLTNLLVNLFMGLAVGVNVLAARNFGAKHYEGVHKTVHTAVTLSLVCGVVLAILGICVCRPCLEMMNTPADVIDMATRYMQIYFIGAPAMLLYNFCAGILRAQGNTKQPLIFLTIAGIVNVILNLIMVICFGMAAEGVAIATTASQFVSAGLIIHYLRDPAAVHRLDFRKLRIHGAELREIIRVGIPSGISSVLFAFSNMQVQASINIFGSVTVAGNAAGSSIDGFIYVACNGFHQAAVNFTGQNIGAGKRERVPKIMGFCLLFATIVGVVLSTVIYLLARPLLSFYTTDAVAISYGVIRLAIVGLFYFLCGAMEVVTGVLRGMGYSLLPTVVSLIGACGFRIFWIATIFRAFKSYEVLLYSYPISWFLTAFTLFVIYLTAMRKHKKK